MRRALLNTVARQRLAAPLSSCAPTASTSSSVRLHALRRGYRSHPSASENSALLRQLETALKDPDALQRLSHQLSPSTARDLSKALSNVHHHRGAVTSAAAASAVEQDLRAAVADNAAAPTATSPRQPATVSLQDLKYVALQHGIPFIGFGFVDNAIMIIAGDYIDVKLGVSLGISSMAAAGIGNTISDIAGLGLGNVVEDMCARLGLPNPALTQEQVRLLLPFVPLLAIVMLMLMSRLTRLCYV